MWRVLAGIVALAVIALALDRFRAPGVDRITTVRSPTRLDAGAEFLCAHGSVAGTATLQLTVEQWQGAPVSARIVSEAQELARFAPKAGTISVGCELRAGRFEVYAINADAQPRALEVRARLVD